MARFLSFLVQHHHKFSAQPEYLVKTYVGAKKSQKKVEGSEGGVRIQGSRPGIMLTCIVRFMAITPIVSERERLQ